MGQPDLSEALNQLWARFLPQTRERVSILESAAEAAAAQQLSIDRQQAARSAAHKLAGVLGTFGLAEGTDLARELESLYSPEKSLDPAASARLASIAARLRTLIEHRN